MAKRAGTSWSLSGVMSYAQLDLKNVAKFVCHLEEFEDEYILKTPRISTVESLTTHEARCESAHKLMRKTARLRAE